MSNSVWPQRWQPIRLPRPWDSLGKNTGVGCHFLLQCRKVKSESEVSQPWQTLCDPMDCSLPGSSVHGISQARVLDWGAMGGFNLHIMHEEFTSQQLAVGSPSQFYLHLRYQHSSLGRNKVTTQDTALKIWDCDYIATREEWILLLHLMIYCWFGPYDEVLCCCVVLICVSR